MNDQCGKQNWILCDKLQYKHLFQFFLQVFDNNNGT